MENGFGGKEYEIDKKRILMPRVPRKLSAEVKQKMAKAYPLRRLGKAEEVANAAVFLASDAASWITGQALSVDGGYTMA